MRTTLFAAVAALGLARSGVAAAQMGQMGGQRIMIPPPTTETEPAIQIFDAEKAKEEISKLRKENKKLKVQVEDLIRERNILKAEVAAYSSKGGKSVKAYCEGSLSRNTAGASTDCAAGGYACEAVSGLCHRSCNITSECAGGFVCHTGNHTCVRP